MTVDESKCAPSWSRTVGNCGAGLSKRWAMAEVRVSVGVRMREQ